MFASRFRAPFALLALSVSLAAFAGEEGLHAITIYSTAAPGAISPEQYRYGGNGQGLPGYATVRDDRDMALKAGRNTVKFTDVAALIDPTTVTFSSISDPSGTRVMEQNFQFDLVSQEKLLTRFIDRDIAVERMVGNKVETLEGKLLSTQGGMVIQEADGTVRTLPYSAGVKLPSLPGGLITRPTLVWDVVAGKAGMQKTRVAYQTSGITWWADYNLTFREGKDANSCKLDVGAWVSILNQSGGSYPDAKIKLVAGDVHRAERPAPAAPMLAKAMRSEATDEARGFVEKSFFEYHLYTLGRPSSLPDNSTKQIELFPKVADVSCEKTLVYYGQAGQYYGGGLMTDRSYGVTGNKKVDTYLSFRNRAEDGMGVPLPSGRVRVAKLDSDDGSMEFIGEDRIDHTPKDETVQLKLGSAFDVVGERRQVDFKVDSNRNTMSEEIEVKIRNHKNEAVRVVVKENLYRWTNWKIVQANQAWDKQDSRTIHFPVTVAADGEAIVRYTVRYTW
ncbi:MAG TPA: DUF4139 domain-containing protein [Burkholderiales bacterium]|nr:DUF4139 domain-containing protein [Burkholderiales bacterium]